MNYLTLTKDTVLAAAQTLIEKDENSDIFGSYTTTLDVKNYLREQGYYAIQSDVSNYMMELAIEDHLAWEKEPGGTYRHYYLLKMQLDDEKEDDEKEIKILKKPEAGCWIVFSYLDPDNYNYLSGNASRNEARAFAEREFSMDYTDIGCNRI